MVSFIRGVVNYQHLRAVLIRVSPLDLVHYSPLALEECHEEHVHVLKGLLLLQLTLKDGVIEIPLVVHVTVIN